MDLRTWLLLLVSQALWSGSYVAMKFAGDELAVGAVVVLRYGLATAAYLALSPWMGFPRFAKRDWRLIALLGALNFALAPTLQVASLRFTQAVDVAILVALEPILTVLLARIVLRERPAGRTWGAMTLAFSGMLILSGAGSPGGAVTSARLWGNLLFVASMFCEVSVTIAGGRLARKYPPLTTMAAMKAAGFLTALAFYFGVMRDADLAAVSAKAWLSLAYLALLASLFSYTVWYHVIRSAPVNQVALSLFAQPLCGAAIGYFLANERLGVSQFLGGALILLSLAWWQVSRRRPIDPTPLAAPQSGPPL